MADLRDRLHDLDRLDVPDVMHRARGIEHPRPVVDPGPGPVRRAATAGLVLAVAMGLIVYLTRPFGSSPDETPPAGPVECGWIQTPYDLPPLAGTAYAVAGTSPEDLWVSEGALEGGDPALLHFDGSSWEEAPLPGGAGIQAMRALGPDDLWAAGSDGVWRFDGSAWTDTGISRQVARDLEASSLEVVAPNDAWIAGYDDEGSVVLHWDGTTWTPTYRGGDATPAVWVDAIDAWSPSDVWAVGAVETGDPTRGDRAPMAIHWDGSTWTEMPMEDREPAKAYQHAAESVVATGPFQATIATSHGIYAWDGSAWTIEDFTPDTVRYGWTLHSGATAIWGITVSMRGNHVTRWDGQEWEWEHVAPERDHWSYDMVAFGDSAVVVGGGYQVDDAPPFAIRVDC